MKYNLPKIKRLVQYSVDIFMDNDILLLKKDVSERAISHRLGCYLQSKISEKVDCEYNRRGFEINPKKINSRKVYPDIIIHNRVDDSNNILAIEIKKFGTKGIEYDVEKLKCFTSSDLGYNFGLQLIFYT